MAHLDQVGLDCGIGTNQTGSFHGREVQIAASFDSVNVVRVF